MHPTSLKPRWHRLPVTNSRWRLALPPAFVLPADAGQWQLLHSGPHSRIYRTDDPWPCVIKLAMPRSQPRDSIRKYLACQGQREFEGNRMLAAIGLQTPEVYGWGMTPAPLARFESALFMRPLPAFTSSLMLIRHDTDAAHRQDFLRALAEQLARVHGHGYIHKDAHFDNLCVLEDASILWIDNDIRVPRTPAALGTGLAKTLKLLESTARGALSDAEWLFFRRWLRTYLARWPQGERLVHEIQ
ncbi:hypothetical protein [Salinisphaera aquimarina]|uniref:Uncharacterized protein n=1 Tax=Salinisphaera aquimarina TaxID=2094031 RepID=A0ABV7EL06_9GAMM